MLNAPLALEVSVLPSIAETAPAANENTQSNVVQHFYVAHAQLYQRCSRGQIRSALTAALLSCSHIVFEAASKNRNSFPPSIT